MEQDKKKGNILARTFKEFGEDDCPRMAAALAYYIVFALPPLLVLILMAAGFFMSPEQVSSWIQQQVSPDAADQIETMIQSASDKVAGGFSIGLILGLAGLVFSATGAFAQLQKALNAAWEVEQDPEQGGKSKILHLLFKRLTSLGMIVVVAFLLAVTMMLSGAVSAFSDQLVRFVAPLGVPRGVAHPLAWVADAIISLGILTLIFAAMFTLLPDVNVRFKEVLFGSFVTAILFVIGKLVVGWYIGQSNPGDAFGAAGSLAAILIFVYYGSMILLLGAEFTQVWARRRGHGVQPSRHAVRVVKEKRHVRQDSGRA